MIEIVSKSISQTKKIARALAFSVREFKAQKGALVLALEGDLGSGKTTFTQGLARGLGVKNKILSPTFVVMKRFELPKIKNQNIRRANFKNFYHVDCYRVLGKDLLGLGFRDIISNPKNLVVIEWAEKVKKILPKRALWIKFKHIDEKTRKINFYFN